MSRPFSFLSYAAHRALHSFPTRRSSDLVTPASTSCSSRNRSSWSTRGRWNFMYPDGKKRPKESVVGMRSAFPTTPLGVGLVRSEEHTSELQSRFDLVCRLLLEKKKSVEVAIIILSIISSISH